MNDGYLGGKASVSLNGITIPSTLIASDGVTIKLEEGIREISTMAGTFKQASGRYDEASVEFNVILPNMEYLKNIFPEMYQKGDYAKGRVAFGGNVCAKRNNTPIVVHYECEDNSDNDVFLPNASIIANVELAMNAEDPVTVTITANAQPDEDGVLIYAGAGSTTEETTYDAAQSKYVAKG